MYDRFQSAESRDTAGQETIGESEHQRTQTQGFEEIPWTASQRDERSKEMEQGMKKVLIACEESQTVCKAFRERGFEAYSCDIQPPSGGHPEWHIKGDVLPLLNGDISFTTVGGV